MNEFHPVHFRTHCKFWILQNSRRERQSWNQGLWPDRMSACDGQIKCCLSAGHARPCSLKTAAGLCTSPSMAQRHCTAFKVSDTSCAKSFSSFSNPSPHCRRAKAATRICRPNCWDILSTKACRKSRDHDHPQEGHFMKHEELSPAAIIAHNRGEFLATG